MAISKANIGQALHSVADDHVTAVANDIYDETLQKYQSEINAEVGQGDGAYDISEAYPADGSPTQFASLQAALTSFTDTSKKKGGMTIKYIGTDGKYHQYRYTLADTTDNNKFTDEDNWEADNNIDIVDVDNESDLEFSDNEGNVALRVGGGDIETKNFNSAKTRKNIGVESFSTFDNEDSYSIGDIVYYNGLLYEFIAEKEAGDWDVSAVKETSVAEICGNPIIAVDIEGFDIAFSDDKGNIVFAVKDGDILTKFFNSKNIRQVSASSINVKDYGAVGDGVTDDTISLESAMAAGFNQKKAVFFPAGTYLIRRSLTLRNGMEIYGVGKNATIKKKAATTTTLTRATSKNDTTVYCNSVDGFSVGDQFFISTDNTDYVSARNCTVGKITAIDTSNNSITFVSLLGNTGAVKAHVVGCHVSNSFAIFRSWGMLYEANNIEIHDLVLDGNRQNDEFGDWMNGCIHIDATTGNLNDIVYQYPASNLTLRDLVVKNSPFDGVSDQGDGGLTMQNCVIMNPYMHGIHLGTTYDGAKITDCEIIGTENGAAFFWCQSVQNVVASNNIIRNCFKGCSDYEYGTPGQNSIITNNIFINIESYTFDFSHPIHSSYPNFKDRFVIGCNLFEDVNGVIANFSGKSKIAFFGNVISNFSGENPECLFIVDNANSLNFVGNIAPSDIVDVYSDESISHLVNIGNSWNQ